jgi:iron complex transport system ATP-binding protein
MRRGPEPQRVLEEQIFIDARLISVTLGARPVLDDVSVTLRQRSGLTALVGPNGAGKSTLLRALAGLVPLAGGEITYGGPVSANGQGREFLVAYLPQDRTVHWDLSVANVVALGRAPYQLAQARQAIPDLRHMDREAIDDAMARMDIRHLAERSIREISGGERARVLIARALAQDTNVLLADEPVAGLDPAHQLSLFGHLRALADDGRAVMVALHDLSLAARFADRVILMHNGRIAADGPAREALSRDHVADVFGIESRLEMVAGVPVVVAVGPVIKLG